MDPAMRGGSHTPRPGGAMKILAIDPGNIAHCPYGIFVYQLTDSPDEVHVGYRHQPAGPMKEVEALLDAIAREAAGLD